MSLKLDIDFGLVTLVSFSFLNLSRSQDLTKIAITIQRLCCQVTSSKPNEIYIFNQIDHAFGRFLDKIPQAKKNAH